MIKYIWNNSKTSKWFHYKFYQITIENINNNEKTFDVYITNLSTDDDKCIKHFNKNKTTLDSVIKYAENIVNKL